VPLNPHRRHHDRPGGPRLPPAGSDPGPTASQAHSSITATAPSVSMRNDKEAPRSRSSRAPWAPTPPKTYSLPLLSSGAHSTALSLLLKPAQRKGD
jgi:hypothetical protein